MIFNSRQTAFKKLITVGQWAGVNLDEELELSHEYGHIKTLKDTSVALSIMVDMVKTESRIMEVWSFSVALNELNGNSFTPLELVTIGTDMRRKAKLAQKLNELGFTIVTKGAA